MPLATWILVVVTAAWSDVGVPHQDSINKKSRAVDFLKQAEQAAAAYELSVGIDRKMKLVLHPKPILRWTNPVIGEIYGGVFIWSAKGRPEVVVSIYRFYSPYQAYGEEFQSLSLGKPISIRDGRSVWRPARPGVELKSVPESPTPDDSPAKRLLQMRKLVKEFSAVKTDYERVDRRLRLLSQPLYRYKSSESDLLDGALFAFVHGTDPEVFLLIEARRIDDDFVWHYAVARSHHRRLRVFHKTQKVWDVSEIPKRKLFDPREPYWKHHLELGKETAQ